MKTHIAFLAIIFITIGYILSYLIPIYFFIDTEIPSLSIFDHKLEKPGPQDYISEDQIIINDDEIRINVQNATWSRYANTNSMDPVFDQGHNGIEIVHECDKLQEGDIVAYQSNIQNGLIVHRIINIESSFEGLLFTLKGDNSPYEDPKKVTCDQIKFQLIGVLY